MRLPFGLEVSRRKASPALMNVVDSRPSVGWSWLPWTIGEPFAGAWQRDCEWTTDGVTAHWAVYACTTLISNDVGKCTPKLVKLDANGIWQEATSPAFSPVLKKPNQYQNRIQFQQWWITSKLLRGNAYALKVRDDRGVVVRLHILDPQRVVVRVAPNGEVFYQLGTDNLAAQDEVSKIVPAREIVHDRMNCLFHPLVGVTPIFACGLAANLGVEILENGTIFFKNGSNPSGVITAPKTIPQATADRIKEHWDNEYSGVNSGKVAVLGDGLKFEPMRMSAEDSQMIEMLRFTAEMVCAAFHVPPFMIGIGDMPTYNNGELLNQIYYSNCLQSLIEEYELVMEFGLGLDVPKEAGEYGIELDVEDLLRMDTATKVNTLKESVGAGIHAPNEARAKLGLPPKQGGDDPYLQQQNYPLWALRRRDLAGPPPNTPGDRRQPTAVAAEPAEPAAPEPDAAEEAEKSMRSRRAWHARLKGATASIRMGTPKPWTS